MIPEKYLKPQDMVTLYDAGPDEPDLPDAVTLDPSDPDHDEKHAKYKADVERYRAAAKDHDEWHRLHGEGPAELNMHVSDAKHALTVEPARYSLDPPGAEDEDEEDDEEEVKDETGV